MYLITGERGRAVVAILLVLLLAAAARAEQPRLLPPELVPPRGLIEITWVQPNSPAYRAGLEIGDRIIEVNGMAVQTLPALRSALLAAGSSARLTVLNRRTAEYLTVYIYPVDGRIGIDARVVAAPWPP
jgi:S1-C subfamily serine protease